MASTSSFLFLFWSLLCKVLTSVANWFWTEQKTDSTIFKSTVNSWNCALYISCWIAELVDHLFMLLTNLTELSKIFSNNLLKNENWKPISSIERSKLSSVEHFAELPRDVEYNEIAFSKWIHVNMIYLFSIFPNGKQCMNHDLDPINQSVFWLDLINFSLKLLTGLEAFLPEARFTDLVSDRFWFPFHSNSCEVHLVTIKAKTRWNRSKNYYSTLVSK